MQKIGEYTGYQPDVNPSIANVFATSAFRFGHSLISPWIRRLDADLNEHPRYGHLLLHQAFFNPYKLVNEGGVDPVLRGLMFTATKDRRIENAKQIHKNLIQRLFEASDEIALDLAALNIQRARDHGLAFYVEWRELCDLPKFNTWEDMEKAISPPNVRKLKEVYKSINLVELYPALLLEKTLPGTRTGETLQCLLIKQFKALRDGDRFWYQNPGEFSPGQLKEIESAKLSDIFCSDSDNLELVADNVFRLDSERVSCQNKPGLNLRKWALDCSTQI